MNENPRHICENMAGVSIFFAGSIDLFMPTKNERGDTAALFFYAVDICCILSEELSKLWFLIDF